MPWGSQLGPKWKDMCAHGGSRQPLLSAGAGGEYGFIPRGAMRPEALQSCRKKDKQIITIRQQQIRTGYDVGDRALDWVGIRRHGLKPLLCSQTAG